MEILKHSSLRVVSFVDLRGWRQVASGSYGSVHLASWNGLPVAVKVIKSQKQILTQNSKEAALHEVLNEAFILGKLHHDNIVRFEFMVSDPLGGVPGIATEFFPDGSLQDVIRRKDPRVGSWDVVSMAAQVADGMAYLHSKRVVHFDLKSSNVLVDLRNAKKPVCKVADFGLAMVKRRRSNLIEIPGQRGTLAYMAPEIIEATYLDHPKVSDKVDVYSFGILMWVLVMASDEVYDRKVPRQRIENNVMIDNIRPKVPEWVDPRWKKLMEQCWAGEACERPSFEEIYLLHTTSDDGQ